MTLNDALELVQLVVDSLYYQGRMPETEHNNITQDEKEEIALAIVEKLKE